MDIEDTEEPRPAPTAAAAVHCMTPGRLGIQAVM